MRVALNQSCLPGLSTAQFVAVAADAGAEAVELRHLGSSESPVVMGNAARAGGLPVASVGPLMDWALRDDPDQVETFEALLDLALAAGSSVIVCVGPMSERPCPSRDETIAVTATHLAALVERARGSGIRLALEQVGLSSSRPGVVGCIRSLQDAFAIVEAVGAGAALCIDSYNLATAAIAYRDLATVPASRVVIAQIADRDPASPWRALPSEGDLDLFQFVESLAAIGYTGALSVETFPQGPWPDPLAAARRAVRSTRRLLGETPPS